MNKEIEEKIFDLYINQKKTVNFIFKELKIHRRDVTNYLHENQLMRNVGQSSRKYKQDDLYFSNIDTPEKAYWLGYFYADGNVASNNCKIKNTVILSSTDLETVEHFKNSVKYTGPIRVETHRKYCKQIYKVAIYSKQMRLDLISNGCVPAKSLIITFPKLQEKLISHFIRGYFDGDGSVGIYKNSSNKEIYTLRSSFCSGSKQFIEELYNFLPVNKIKHIQIRKKPIIYSINFSVEDSLSLANFMYKDATIFLTRKKEKFDKYRERRSTTIIDHPEKDEGIV